MTPRTLCTAVRRTLAATFLAACASSARAQGLPELDTALTGWQGVFETAAPIIVVIALIIVGIMFVFNVGTGRQIANVAIGGFIAGAAVGIGSYLMPGGGT